MNRIILVSGNLDPTISYEYHNFLKPLENMGEEVFSFDFKKIMDVCGREQMNIKLLNFVKEIKPYLVIFVPQTDEFIPNIVHEIGQFSITLGYFFDDMWRIDFSRFWAQHYNFVTTSDVYGVIKFKNAGYSNVIFSPFACNTQVYTKKNITKIYDVTFVGGYNPYREWYINFLKKKGIDVQVWGFGWESSMLSSEEMINVFNQSRINLNLSNSICWDIRYLTDRSRSIIKTIKIWKQTYLATRQPDLKTVEQIKGRHFEINACGGFQLSYYVEGLEKFYDIGKEISLYYSPEDLYQKIRYYLNNENERNRIALQGYERTRQEHSMEKRFLYIFEQINYLRNK